jgi:PST family polysaccharide transporter
VNDVSDVPELAEAHVGAKSGLLAVAADPIDAQEGLAARAARLEHRIMAGARWTTLAQALTQLFRFLLAMFLARLLAPAEFGLMTIALVTVGLVDLVKDFGTTAALVRAADVSQRLLNAIFYFNVLLGAVAVIVLSTLAEPIAAAYSEPDLVSIVQVLAGTILISSLTLPQRGLIVRELRFGRLAAIDLAATGVYGLVALLLALSGLGVWSLVLGTVASTLASTVLLWQLSSFRPGLAVDLPGLRGLAGFSLNMTGTQVFSYLLTQADRLLIGAVLGQTAVGLYAVAHQMTDAALAFITTPVTKVLFPAFASIEHDDQLIASLYTRACATIACLAFPILIGFALVAEPLIAVALGDKWGGLVPIILVLTTPKLVQSLAMTLSAIYQAKGRADWLFRWQVFAGATTVGSFGIGMFWGLQGVAWAYAAATLLLTYPAFALPFRLIHLPVTTFARSLLPYVAGSLVMAVAVLLAQAALDAAAVAPWLLLLGSVAVGVVVYAAIMLRFRPQALEGLSSFLLVRRLS